MLYKYFPGSQPFAVFVNKVKEGWDFMLAIITPATTMTDTKNAKSKWWKWCQNDDNFAKENIAINTL